LPLLQKDARWENFKRHMNILQALVGQIGAKEKHSYGLFLSNFTYMKRKSAQRTKIFEVDRAALGSME